jgi:glycosyltransferase involved in cell wall biosynthesis
MSVIVMADDGVPFDGNSLVAGPLGGAETAFIGLANGLAELGHRVYAFTKGKHRFSRNGVDWLSIDAGLPEAADLYIANRGHRLLDQVRKARRVAFWVHNPADYVVKPRYLIRLWRRRPVVVFLGPYHSSTLPSWVPSGGRVVIPYGIDPHFQQATERAPSVPRAIFTSNPLRGLDWLMDRWADDIQPNVLGAELHVYSGLATYGGGDASKRALAAPILARAEALSGKGVVLHPPVAKAQLAAALTQARVFLYGGDPGETFCLAAAESQAMGVPGVVRRSTCLAERVVDGRTGFVLDDGDDAGFAARAVSLLTDDTLWQAQHRACLAEQRGLYWVNVARHWEALLP